MRIALVSPYSWTYPGGVTRHIEALADEFEAGGHFVRILAPVDPPDRASAIAHRGAWPQQRAADPRLIGLGRTVGFAANGAVSNLAATPYAISTLRRELRAGDFDVAHLHEPIAPVVGWDALCSSDVPLVGTFHCYSANAVSNGLANLLGARRRLNRLRVRIAVSEAAAWTGRRFYGGRYRVIPNGVDLHEGLGGRTAAVMSGGGDPSGADRGADDPLRIVFVGQTVERKGLPVLLRAFEALREQVPARLTIIGASADEVAPLLLDDRDVTVMGKAADAEKWAALREADVLCAPSLGGESFGMVLTEAFAAGTPVLASDIPGYSDVVRDGIDGRLVARGDATMLAERLREMALDAPGRRQMARAARERAERFGWPHVAGEVLDAYRDALSIPDPAGARQRRAVRHGLRPADLGPPARPERLPTLEPPEPSSARGVAVLRRIAFAVAGAAGLLLALLALQRIGLDRIAGSLLASSPSWVVIALGLMCVSMIMRAFAWHAILTAALPGRRVRRRDALQGTFIGVLMSATLPARLGEPSRALIVARRLGRAREAFPVVLGTIVSQALLNILALSILGAVMFSNINVFNGHHAALVAATVAPLAVALTVLVAPALVPQQTLTRHARMQTLMTRLRDGLSRIREGLLVFRRPRLAATAVAAQLGAWGVQWMACYVLLVALGLNHHAGVGAAAAVLFAVNVTAAIPVTPSNVGIFQAACVAVLAGAYHVSTADALAYGIILQAVEIATALVMGMPALVNEGMSWRDVRLRALHGSPVHLAPRRVSEAGAGRAEAGA
jgi:phosphatidyl-myo-inositol alpha-mannosyltransferase